ncbi:Aste57867_10093 [Aphanomyces stellatus]|uniref:Regulator of microtubule dynamics protein 1 n=1 Tax=Aphanomyces stellatus TaxID=120398 RepID=A0A485KPH6_9STRA|nr:hypothetical protein As57867_010054 [Aphanomyces stellatus]VFT86969.1 Aste57867_10093 [Aphanomyces stellatus]
MPSTDDVIAQADIFLNDPQKHTWHSCGKLLQAANQASPGDPEILLRLSRIAIEVAKLPSTSLATKIKSSSASINYAKVAVELAPDNVITHRTLAVAFINAQKYLVAPATVFANHQPLRTALLRTIELGDDDAATWHFYLGKCLFTVAHIGWFDLVVGNSIFGELEPATFDEALACFEKAQALSPDTNRENSYYMAAALTKLQRNAQAKAWLAKALGMPTPAEMSAEDDKAFSDMAWSLGASLA